jgi:hypothetical protein
MPSHKFHVGDTVMLKPSISRNVPGGVYEVIRTYLKIARRSRSAINVG